MARLGKQLATSKPSSTAQAAGLWQSLPEILGDKGIATLFSAWAKLQVDESKPGTQLGKALMAQGDTAKLEPWWQKAQPVLLVASAPRASSRRKADPPASSRARARSWPGMTAFPGKLSSAGSGHSVRFDAPGKDSYLAAVRIYGSRYGHPQPPRENASIWLCDAEFKKIAEFPCPYYFFQRGDPKWVTVSVKPTQKTAAVHHLRLIQPHRDQGRVRSSRRRRLRQFQRAPARQQGPPL